MTSSRRAAIAVLTALVVMLAVAAAPAGAAGNLGHGLNGFVGDADTGLPLSGAVVTWLGTLQPPPTATTDATGRYLFTGLEPGTTGKVTVDGPAGWDHGEADAVALPVNGFATQNFQLHRDWITPAGGATITAANDDSGTSGGCGPAQAVDNLRSTGWSASATRPASDPPSLTVQLPATVDVSQLIIDPSSACSHPAGAALGHYRVLTSPDGSAWTTALEGTFDATALNKANTLTPTAGTSGVRFVRLQLLSPQDATSPTVDVSELQVFGQGPDQPPAGTVTAESAKNFINSVVRLHAAFTDPDSAIVHYLWDFNGDGVWDQATIGPDVAHVWQGAGTYQVTVGVRDFQGALGTAAIALRIDDPNAPVEPILQRKPLITYTPPNGIDLPLRIACSSICTFKAKLTMTAGMARRLHARHRVVDSLHRKTEGPGLGSWIMELPASLIKRLHHANVSKLKTLLTARAVDQQGRSTTLRRWVTFR